MSLYQCLQYFTTEHQKYWINQYPSQFLQLSKSIQISYYHFILLHGNYHNIPIANLLFCYILSIILILINVFHLISINVFNIMPLKVYWSRKSFFLLFHRIFFCLWMYFLLLNKANQIFLLNFLLKLYQILANIQISQVYLNISLQKRESLQCVEVTSKFVDYFEIVMKIFDYNYFLIIHRNM